MMENKHRPSVSVIVPCYNYGAFLAECLDSVLAQTFQDWECIVVDNVSTDDTKQITEKYVQRDARFKYVYCTVRGVSAARNFGIYSSIGEYILPLDADDRIAPDYLRQAVKIISGQRNIKIVYCKAALFGHVSGNWNLPAYSLEQMLKQNVIFVTGMYRRSDYDRTKGYNEAFLQGFEDWDFWLSMLESGGEVYCIDEVLFYYRIRKTSRNNSLDEARQRQLRRMVYENHKALYDDVINLSDVLFERYLLQTRYDAINNSKDYKIGRALLGPLRAIKRIFGK